MTPEEKSLLERVAKLSEENNEILRSMHRAARRQAAFQIAYWVVILALTFGAFYFIQPYIDSLTGALGIGGGADGQVSYAQQLQQALGKF